MNKLIAVSMVLLAACSHAQKVERKVDSQLINAIIHVESNNDPNALGAAGERGLMQIRPIAWKHMNKLHNRNWHFDEAFNPEKNKQVGEEYLLWIQLQLETASMYTEERLISAYNAGYKRLKKDWDWEIKNTSYIKKVINKWNN